MRPSFNNDCPVCLQLNSRLALIAHHVGPTYQSPAFVAEECTDHNYEHPVHTSPQKSDKHSYQGVTNSPSHRVYQTNPAASTYAGTLHNIKDLAADVQNVKESVI